MAQIGAALHAYHERYRSFPPAYVVGGDGKRRHSWRVLILPFLGRDDLYREYRFDEPWDGPNNRLLISRMPDVFACPASGSSEGVTNYLAVVGRATAWPERYSARLEDFLDGASYSIQLIESADSDILWLEPRDLTHLQALGRDRSVKRPTPGAGHATVMAALADGNVRSLALERLDRKILANLMSIAGGRPLAGVEWPPEDAFGLHELPPTQPAEEFPQTDVLPYPDGPILSGRNYVYCATMAIAWHQFRDCVGGDEVQLSDDPPLATALNRHVFDVTNLSPESYVARAGNVSDGIIQEIRAEIAAKSPGADPRLIDRAEGHAYLLYAYLQKLLPFGTEFDVLEQPLQFSPNTSQRGKPVKAFGVHPLEDNGYRDEMIKSQVTILDYINDDDFVLRLENTSARDEIVLAKVAPGGTLAETIAQTRRRGVKPHGKQVEARLRVGESLAVPIVVASLTREYTELAGRDILNSYATGRTILSATQNVRFRLDEAGARLESEAAIVGEFGEDVVPRLRHFVFNRPFLLYLIERDADQPYLAIWIGNTELLEPIAK
jgi:hypothetical protein